MNILETIQKNGYIDSSKVPLDEIKKLEEEGVIQTLASAQGFDTMNDAYIYVLMGNPRNVRWDDKGYGLWELEVD